MALRCSIVCCWKSFDGSPKSIKCWWSKVGAKDHQGPYPTSKGKEVQRGNGTLVHEMPCKYRMGLQQRSTKILTLVASFWIVSMVDLSQRYGSRDIKVIPLKTLGKSFGCTTCGGPNWVPDLWTCCLNTWRVASAEESEKEHPTRFGWAQTRTNSLGIFYVFRKLMKSAVCGVGSNCYEELRASQQEKHPN
ncbi:hypothetical protein B0H19DRAFT_1080311 [Mycena capillaripes]|nr:hypothetical protein B0H19DRAFT_1080311 [Mycena capillaripes]